MSENPRYNLIKEDPTLQVELVDKYVSVHIILKQTYAGFLHSIDPISGSIILSIPQEETFKTIIIPGHAILDITEEEVPANLKPPQRKQIQTDSKEELIKRKNKLRAWFESNLLPVTEINEKLVIGDVSLLPPYNTMDLFTENPIVALQIKKIMERMPDDFSK